MMKIRVFKSPDKKEKIVRLALRQLNGEEVELGIVNEHGVLRSGLCKIGPYGIHRYCNIGKDDGFALTSKGCLCDSCRCHELIP